MTQDERARLAAAERENAASAALARAQAEEIVRLRAAVEALAIAAEQSRAQHGAHTAAALADKARVDRILAELHGPHPDGGLRPLVTSHGARLTTMENQKPLFARIGDTVVGWFLSVFTAGDRSRRPWVFITLVFLFLASGAAYFYRETFMDPASREERAAVRAAEALAKRQQFVLDSLRLRIAANARTIRRQAATLDTLTAAVDSLTGQEPE